MRSISSKVRTSERGSHCHALRRHAVGAAEVAPVGHRDAQIAMDAPERVDQRSTQTGRCRPPVMVAQGTGRRGDHLDGRRRRNLHRAHTVTVGQDGQPVGGGPSRRVVRALPTRRRWPHAVCSSSPRRPGEVHLAVRPAAQGLVGDRLDRRPVEIPMWPAILRSAGRANSSNVTIDDTGLPGSPNTGVFLPAAPAPCRRRAAWPA